MARVGSVNLEVILSGDSDATVEGSWTIEFNAFDVSSNLEYQEAVSLVGVDRDVGDVNDHFNDQLRVLRAEVIRADGATTVARSITSSVPRRLLNEDPSPIQPRDEIQLIVAIEPQVRADAGLSNIVRAQFT
jgi:hypothetical protein